jgi:alpha-D-ribose 1-methylphosphonate 5-triphosphate synthase subunit PhnG
MERDYQKGEEKKQRRRWMEAMALSQPEELETAYQALSFQPAYHFLRPPESGMIMLRGRVGGDGSVFNMGEATVTRCTVFLKDGPTGAAYVLGGNHRKAELMAVFDALLQDRRYNETIMNGVIEPLELQNHKRKKILTKKAAATKVDFYTMVRGE